MVGDGGLAGGSGSLGSAGIDGSSTSASSAMDRSGSQLRLRVGFLGWYSSRFTGCVEPGIWRELRMRSLQGNRVVIQQGDDGATCDQPGDDDREEDSHDDWDLDNRLLPALDEDPLYGPFTGEVLALSEDAPTEVTTGSVP
jgi:hypothetical protein